MQFGWYGTLDQGIPLIVGPDQSSGRVALPNAAGMVTPGGPMTSFPLVNALHGLGTGRAALIAYLTSWSTLGLQRILSWELPLMGVEFASSDEFVEVAGSEVGAGHARLER